MDNLKKRPAKLAPKLTLDIYNTLAILNLILIKVRKMNTIQKIAALNKKCEDSLGLQCYSVGWEVSSFRSGTPLEVGSTIGHVKAPTLKEAVDKAYQLVFGSK